MKKNKVIVLWFLAAQSIVFAGGNILPKENTKVEDSVTIPILNDSKSFYVGLGRADLSLENTLTKESFTTKGIVLQAGYMYNKYMSIEGRYTQHVGKVHYYHGDRHQTNGGVDIPDYPTDFTNIAVYVKPTYKISSTTLYGLVGYGEVTLTNIPLGDVDRTENGFQWGLGISQDITENFAIYFDYVNMYDGIGFDDRARNANIKSNTWTLGVSYKF